VAKLDAVVIGNSASMLNGAPVTTQDVDLLIRDTKANRRKLAIFAEEIGGSSPGGLTFASVRSRAQSVTVGDERLAVAALADVIRSKQAANRPKDRAVLPILRDTMAVKKKLE